MDETTCFSIDALQTLVLNILDRAGLSAVQANALARVIVAAERDACKSHGVYRLEGILRTVRSGKVDPMAEPVLIEGPETAIVKVDARNGFANAAFGHGLPALVARTRKLGFAAMVINDCCHFAALWPEVEALADQGLAAISMCPSYATVAPSGGTKPVLGTNPFAFGWPRPNRAPYIFDFATSVAARGEIELLGRAGKRLPEGWALDAQGQPTTDPEAALSGSMLPFGTHKGSAISTMIELLAAIMIGDMTSLEALNFMGSTALAPVHGELILAFDPAQFSAGRAGNPLDRAEHLFETLMGSGARLPSQRRFRAREKAVNEGIILTGAEVLTLDRLLAGGADAAR